MIRPVLPEQATSGPSGLPRHELTGWPAPGMRVVAGVAGGRDQWDFRIDPCGEAPPPTPRAWCTLLQDISGFATAFGGRQVHGTFIEAHRSPDPGIHVGAGVDGHVTDRPGILLAVTVADCIPVYLASSTGGTVALLHAGWRGIAKGILEAGVDKLIELGGCLVTDIVMHCGIGVCGDCYEVGSEVHQALGTGCRTGKVDLRQVLGDRALALGIANVTVSTHCASHDADRFFSHRRSGGRAGRMAAYLGIRAG